MLETVPFVCGALALRYAVRGAVDLLQDRALSQRPTPIAEAREGLVLVAGRIVSEGPRLLEGPLSATPCVVARSSLFDLEGQIVDRMITMPFLLEDGTGRIRVDAEIGRTTFNGAWSWERSVNERELDERARAMLRPGFTVQERGRRERTIRLVEEMLFPGDSIFVLGTAQVEVTPTGEAADYRTPPTLRTLRASGRHGLHIHVGDRPSLRRAAMRDLGKGVIGLAAAALGIALF